MKRIHRQITIIGLIIFICLIYLVLALQIANNQKIAWGVKIANARLAERDVSTAEDILKEKRQTFTNQNTTLTYQDDSWLVRISDLGLELDHQTTIYSAYQIGRKSNVLTNFKEQLFALFGNYNLQPIYKIDQDKFQKQTTELFKNIEKPAQNASLVFNEELDDFSLQHSTKGLIINRQQLLTDLSERIEVFSNQPIVLQIIIDKPSVENNEVDKAKQKAQQILNNQPYQLIFESENWTIDQKQLIDWLKFDPIKEENYDNFILGLVLDKDKIEKYLKNIALSIDQPTINAQLQTQNNRAVVFVPEQEGFEIKINETINQLTENILSEPPIKKTTIIASKALPKIILKQTNKLGINSLIGQGTSNFAGSPNNRIHNIKTGSSKFNGLILNPDEEFSFNNLLGGSGPEQGFLPELVIKKNKLVPEYGGGLCQVSTTFFRSAVNSGLKITQRTAHAFPVVYYNPQGFDATVYEPRPDLRFINNTSAHLLIETVVKGTRLTFNFYGTDDGQKVKIKGPYILEKNEDGSMKTVLTQEVYRNEELIEKQTFYSNYQSPDLFPIE